MRTLTELKEAVASGKKLVWNDPDPIKGNDYTISFIEVLTDIEDVDANCTPILIMYNEGGSEAQVYLHEILIA